MTDENVPTPLPTGLQEIVDDFDGLPPNAKLELLLDFANGLPDLPERYMDHPELMEPVPECQSPIFLVTEIDDAGPEPIAHLFFAAPREAPTTRGFAGILHEGLDGLPVTAVLSLPSDFSTRLPVADAVSPLRMRGLAAMVARVQRQLRTQFDSANQ